MPNSCHPTNSVGALKNSNSNLVYSCPAASATCCALRHQKVTSRSPSKLWRKTLVRILKLARKHRLHEMPRTDNLHSWKVMGFSKSIISCYYAVNEPKFAEGQPFKL